MPALFRETTKGPNKKKVLSCSSKCYNAKRKLCNCPCNGKNHGVGAAQALANTIEMQKAGKAGVEFNQKTIDKMVKDFGTQIETEQTPNNGSGPATDPVVTPDPINFNAIGDDVAMAKATNVVRPRDAKGHFIKVS